MPYKTVLDNWQIAEIVKAYLYEGKSTQQLADQYYVSKPTIGNYLKAAGVPMRGKGGNNNPTGYCGRWSSKSVPKGYE